MSKEKLYGLRDQLSKFLYDPTPDQAAWRDKMWEEGRFDESIKITKQVEAQLEEVETQIEAFEAAEPSLGKKIVTNTLLNLPLGKQLKGTGLGSLLGLAEEELGAAETQRLKDIEQEIYELNAIRQRDLEGGRVSSGTLRKIDADIRALENEGTELKQLLSTPLSEEPEDRKMQLFEEFIKDKTDLTFAEEEFLKAYPEFGSPSTRQLTPEQILEELGVQEGTVYDEELLKNAEGLAKGMGISTEELQNALQQREKEGLMSLIGKTPTTEEAERDLLGDSYETVKALENMSLRNFPEWKTWNRAKIEKHLAKSEKLQRILEKEIARSEPELSVVPTKKGEIRRFQWMANKEGGQEYGNLEELRPITKELFEKDIKHLTKFDTFEEYIKASPDLLARYISQDKGKTWKLLKVEDEAYFLEEKRKKGPWRIEVSSFDSDEAIKQGTTADSDLDKGYQGGGLVMNYGDYGRSYK